MTNDKENELLNAVLEELENDYTELGDLDLSGLDDEPEETSFDRETSDYDFDVENDYSVDEVIRPAKQLKTNISFDAIKLKLSLTEAEYVCFEVERAKFFRTPKPKMPATEKEDMLHLLGVAENPVKTMVLDEKEKSFVDRSMEYEYAKTKYPNAKPFFDYVRRLGVGHMYFENGNFVCQINGKITSGNGDL